MMGNWGAGELGRWGAGAGEVGSGSCVAGGGKWEQGSGRWIVSDDGELGSRRWGRAFAEKHNDVGRWGWGARAGDWELESFG